MLKRPVQIEAATLKVSSTQEGRFLNYAQHQESEIIYVLAEEADAGSVPTEKARVTAQTGASTFDPIVPAHLSVVPPGLARTQLRSYAKQNLHDPLNCVSVPELRHSSDLAAAGKDLVGSGDNPLGIGSDNLVRAFRHSHRAFSIRPQGETGHAERRGLLLYTPGVRQHEPCPAH